MPHPNEIGPQRDRPSGTDGDFRSIQDVPTSAAVRGRFVIGPSEAWSQPASQRPPAVARRCRSRRPANVPSAAPRLGFRPTAARARRRPGPARVDPADACVLGRRSAAAEAMFPAHRKPSPSVPFSSTPPAGHREDVVRDRDVLGPERAARAAEAGVELEAGPGGIDDRVERDQDVARPEVPVQRRVGDARRDPEAALAPRRRCSC